jgi:hypothetical protein
MNLEEACERLIKIIENDTLGEATDRLTAILDDESLTTLELFRSAVTSLWDDMKASLEPADPEGPLGGGSYGGPGDGVP